jgi:hypothetical protein
MLNKIKYEENKMKKIITFIVTLAAVLFLAACLQPISEVKSFTLSGWTPKDYYGIGDQDAVWPGNVTLNVVYQDNQTETLNLGSSVNDGTVTVTGDYVESPLGLDTSEEGFLSVTISVDNVSLTFEFYVFNLVGARYVGVGETYTTISSALSGVPNGTTIIVANGTYNESLTINGRTGVTIYGESQAGVIIDSSNQTSRSIQASNSPQLTLINLTVRDTYAVGGSSVKRFMVKIDTNSHDFTIRNVVIEGPGKNYLNPSDANNTVGGLDLNTLNNASVENVTVRNVSRNAMAFTSVSNLRVADFTLQNISQDASGWAAIALYGTTTLLEIVGSMDNANIGINYSVPPFAGFEFGNIAFTNVNYPLFFDHTHVGSIEQADSFAITVMGLDWRIELSPYNWLAYFVTESEANQRASELETAFAGTSATVTNIGN